MELSDRLARIKQKLQCLVDFDGRNGTVTIDCRAIFPPNVMELNPCASDTELADFEKALNIVLPEEYRGFLAQVCNGKAGPAYGLYSIEEVKYYTWELDRVCLPFPHTGYYNPPFDPVTEEFGDGFVENEFDGILHICSYGCGIGVLLVVTGRERSNLWCNDTGNDNGLYPLTRDITPGSGHVNSEERIGLLDWYENWLDRSMDKIAAVSGPQ